MEVACMQSVLGWETAAMSQGPMATSRSCATEFPYTSSTKRIPVCRHPMNHDGLSNVNSLPVEMLQEIFLKAIEVDLSTGLCLTDFDGTLSNHVPLVVVLSQVCSLWRRIVLSIPSLWSTIRVIPSSQHQAAQMHWTKIFLSRSSTQPLDLVLKDCRSRSGSATSSGCREICATRSILSLLLSRARFWRSIDFHVSHEVLDMLFMMLGSSSKRLHAPNLRSASVLVSKETCEKLPPDHLSCPVSFINGTWANPFLATVWRSIFSSPNMKEMTWWPGFHRIFPNPPVAMFDRVTSLNIHYSISAEEVLHILPYFLGIKEVIVTNLRLQSFTGDISPGPQLLLSSLETLYLRASVEVGPVLEKLLAPSLLSFRLCYLDSMKPSIDDAHSFHRFLQHSGCHLSNFALHHDVDDNLRPGEKNFAAISMYLESSALRWMSTFETNGLVLHDAWRLGQFL